MTILVYALGALATFMASWAIVRAWIDFAPRLKLIDVPNARSSHTRATPRGGGVGIVVATVVGVAVAIFSGRAGSHSDAVWAGVLAFAIAVISFVDDVRSLPPRVRLVLHVGVAIVATQKLGVFPALTIPFLEPVALPQWAGMFLTVVWIVGLTNAYNFMDGIDGIAGVQGTVGGFAWAWFGANMYVGGGLLLWIGLSVAAACAGFLMHNWSPAKVFMGDVGSAFLGFVFAVLPLLVLHGRVATDAETLRLQGAVPVFAALVVWPFVADAAFTFFRRAIKQENVLKSHRSHLYQRLTIAGWRHVTTTRLYLGWAAASFLLGNEYLFATDAGRLTILVLALVMFIFMVVLVGRVERRATGARLRNSSRVSQ